MLEPRETAPEDSGTVTAFVPARNEAEVIGRALEGLIAQGAALDRIVVTDDGSTDGTVERIEHLVRDHPRLHLVHGPGPRDGECGKPAALRDAVAELRPKTEWLLFADADVVLARGALGALLDAARKASADLVSIVPRVEMETAIEKLVMPSIGALVLAQFPPDRVADPARPIAFANGQLILVRRSVYDRAGGHAAVASEILEDVRLAARVKASGGRLLIVDGRRIAATRMYEGWAAIEEGWSKNLFLLLGSSVRRALVWLVALNALAWAGVIAGLLAGWPAGLAAYGVVLAFQMILRGRGGASPAWAALAPVSSLLVSRILLRSAWLHESGAAIPWKERAYGGRDPRPPA